MTKVCIICRKNKEKFNQEHILLATIGGSLLINNVCKTCNEELSKKFNEPFLKSPIVGYYRQKFSLYRSDKRTGSRSISNPFKKSELQSDNGEKYYLSFENGEPKAKLKPTITITESKEGDLHGQIVASKEDIENIKSNVFKKYGVDESQTVLTAKISTTPPLSLFVSVPNAPILLEGLKIAYEYTVTTIPEYFNDNWAIKISEFLYKGEHYDLVKNRIESVSLLISSLKDEFLRLNKSPSHLHIISLKQIKGIGLFCFVKIFDSVIPYHLSDNHYIDNVDKEFAVYNDAIKRHHFFVLSVRWRTINLTIGFNSMNHNDIVIIQTDFRKGYKSIKSDDDNIPIFNHEGMLINESLSNFILFAFQLNKKVDFANKKVTFDIVFSKEEIFVKHYPTDNLLPVLKILAEYDITL